MNFSGHSRGDIFRQDGEAEDPVDGKTLEKFLKND